MNTLSIMFTIVLLTIIALYIGKALFRKAEQLIFIPSAILFFGALPFLILSFTTNKEDQTIGYGILFLIIFSAFIITVIVSSYYFKYYTKPDESNQ